MAAQPGGERHCVFYGVVYPDGFAAWPPPAHDEGDDDGDPARCCQRFVGVGLPVQGEVADGLSIDFDSYGVRIVSVCGLGNEGAPRDDCPAATVPLGSEGAVCADDSADGGFVLVHNVQTDAPIVDEGRVVTNGGRVLDVTALGKTIREARERAYAAAEKISFANKYMRTDIALAGVAAEEAQQA